MSRKKSEVQQLISYKTKLHHEIKDLEEQNNILILRITNLKRKEGISLTYLDWFKSLRQDLFVQHHIRLEEEINSFVNVFTEFKYYGYDAHQIVKEYQVIESLKEELKIFQGIVVQLKKSHDELLMEIESLDERRKYYSQSLNTILELDDAGFGLKELKQLKNIVMEIGIANDIKIRDVAKKFLKDVENQYDNKLGFENKIEEIKNRVEKHRK